MKETRLQKTENLAGPIFKKSNKSMIRETWRGYIYGIPWRPLGHKHF